MTITSNLVAVPKGYTYYKKSTGKNYYWGERFPTPENGDQLFSLENGDASINHYYDYYTTLSWGGISEGAGWVGSVASKTLTYSTPGAPLANAIGGKPVRVFSYRNCTKMLSSPNLSEYTNLQYVTFSGCKLLKSIGGLPPNLRSIQYAFENTNIAAIPSSIPYAKIEKALGAFKGTQITSTPNMSLFTKLTEIAYMFEDCTKLTTVANYPPNVTDMIAAFKGCTSLTSVPEIPKTVNNLYRTFYGCTKLHGQIKVNCEALGNTYQAFTNTGRIALVDDANDSNWDLCVKLASAYSNVYFPTHANADSMNLIRCLNDSEYTDDTMGGYIKLLIDYTLEPEYGSDIYYNGVEMKDENDNALTIGTVFTGIYDGSSISTLAVGDQLPSSGRLILVDPLTTYVGTSSTSGNFIARLKSYYYYGDTKKYVLDGRKYLTLTDASFAIDVNVDSTAVGVLMEAPDNEKGLYSSGLITAQNVQTSPSKAISVVNSSGVEKFYVDWDGGSSLDDYTVETGVTDGWSWKKYASGLYEAEKVISLGNVTASTGIVTIDTTRNLILKATAALPTSNYTPPHASDLQSGYFVLYTYLSNDTGYTFLLPTSGYKFQMGRFVIGSGNFTFENVKVLAKVVNGHWK